MRILALMLLFVSMSAMAANDLKLVVSPGQDDISPDGKSIDVTSAAAGAEVSFDVVIENMDFVLAGLEFQFRYPRYLTQMDDTLADWQDGNAPITVHSDWAVATQQLPASATGDITNETVNNTFGTVRFGILALDPANRPSGDGTTTITVATITIKLNNATDATCISGLEKVEIFSCGAATGGACDIVANGSAERVTLSGDSVARTASITRSDVPVKGDFNGNGEIDPGDIGLAIVCANRLPGCPIDPLVDTQEGDVNCSGGVIDPVDVQAEILLANRILGFSFGKRDFGTTALNAGPNHIMIDSKGAQGLTYTLDFAVSGDVDFADAIKIDENGWFAAGSYADNYGVYRVTLARLDGQSTAFPAIKIPYSADSRSAVTLVNASYYNGDAELFNTIPAVNAGDLANREGTTRENGRTRN